MKTKDSSKPDFAFPATVVADARGRLDKAVADGDTRGELRALIDLTIAETSIEPAKMQQMVELTDSLARQATSPSQRVMLLLLEARQLSAAYEANRWSYDERQLPLSPLPTDITEWSGEQYRTQIDSLCAEALADPAALKAVGISEFKGVIDYSPEYAAYYSTLLDFVAYEAIDMVEESLSELSIPLSALSLYPGNPTALAGIARTNPAMEQILDWYGLLITNNPEGSFARTNAELKRLAFLRSKVYSALRDETRTKYTELLRGLYEQLKGRPVAADVLLAINSEATSEDDEKWLYGELNNALKAYPDYQFANSLRQAIADLSRCQATVSAPSYITPGVPFEVEVQDRNFTSLTLKLYRVEPAKLTDSEIDLKGLDGAVPLATRELTFGDTVPFNSWATATFTVDAYGCYVVVTEDAGRDLNHYYHLIRSTRLAPGMLSLEGRQLLVVDRITGVPVGDVDATLLPRRKKDVERALGATDSEGLLAVDNEAYGDILLAKGADRYAPLGSVWTASEPDYDDSRMILTGVTDLAVYHPGDTVGFMATVYRHYESTNTNRVAAKMKLHAMLCDANGQTVDSLWLTTDDFGRAEGSFEIPKGLMTGRFTVLFSNVNQYGYVGSIGFIVSDYKLPTFRIEDVTAVRDTPASGDVTLRGRATTYAGLPVAGAEVKVQLSSQNRGRFWWILPDVTTFHNASGFTDESGEFNIVISDTTLQLAPFPQGLFTANVTVTSTAAESHAADCCFTLGKPYAISATIDNALDVSRPVDLKVVVYGPDGAKTAKTVDYRFRSGDDTVLTGKIEPDAPMVNLDKLPSGEYALDLSLAGADTLTFNQVVVYSPTDKMPPVESLLWVPTDDYAAPGDVLFGTSNPTTHILAIVSGEGRVISCEWLTLEAGLHCFAPEVPDSAKSVVVTLIATLNGNSVVETIRVQNPKAVKSIKITSSTFRDRLVPGTDEEWTLTVTNQDSEGVRAAVALDVYNAALDAIAYSPFAIHAMLTSKPELSVKQPVVGRSFSSSIQSPYKPFKTKQLQMPYLNTYGLPFIGAGRYRILHNYNMKLSRSMADGAMIEEDAVEMAAPMAAAKPAMATTMAPAMAKATADTGASPAPEQKEPKMDLRKGDLTLAFFRPMLTTDGQGRAIVRFTVPNANTTLSLNALAFTPEMLTANCSLNAIVAKRVIVTPNLPRFLRTADRARLDATVFNNSDDEQTITTVIETFNPADGAVTARETVSHTLAPKASAIASIEVKAPVDAPFMGYRVVATAGEFSDGEQQIVPIEPSTQPVIETYPFYLSPDSLEFAMSLPKMSEGARLTLRYCDNPLWYVVTALPGLAEPAINTPTAAAASLFSVTLAEHLMATQPLLADAIKRWHAEGDDSEMLVSMLQRNPELKQFMLNATPWMMNAASDTERMQRLVLLFDSATVESARQKAVEILRRREVDGGGWSWYDGFNDWSKWTTEETLLSLGAFGRLGLKLPDEVTAMALRALPRLQDEFVDWSRKYPEMNFPGWAQIASFWPQFTPSADGEVLIKKAIDKLVKNWKDIVLVNMPEEAMLLDHYNKTATAREILESLRQFATVTPEQGMFWRANILNSSELTTLLTAAGAIEAFHTIEPESDAADLIRQWLIIEKQTTDWGDAAIASRVVAAVVATTGKWVEAAGDVTAAVDGRPLQLPAADELVGEFTVDISDAAAGKSELTIHRTKGTPAWGSVVRRSVEPMSEIKAHSCEALSIEKTLFKSDGNGWIAADTLRAGDRVKIELTIHADRNIDYMTIADQRAACLEPVDQLPGYIFAEGIAFYRENRDTATNIFIRRLPAGTYRLSYEMWVNNVGTFSSGIATAQSQYAPEILAHSAAAPLTVEMLK